MTNKQKNWVLKRDSHKCQHVLLSPSGARQCFVTTPLEVHHIFSKRFIKRWFPNDDTDHPFNMLTLCIHHHRTHVHPDIEEAIMNYDNEDYITNTIEEVLRNRDALVERGIPYWNTETDCIYNHIARINTLKFKESFPESKPRAKKYDVI